MQESIKKTTKSKGAQAIEHLLARMSPWVQTTIPQEVYNKLLWIIVTPLCCRTLNLLLLSNCIWIPVIWPPSLTPTPFPSNLYSFFPF
jgi:hypothetical protein